MDTLKAAYLDWMRARIAYWTWMIEFTNLTIRRAQGGIVTVDQEMDCQSRCDTASRVEQMARNAYAQCQDNWVTVGGFKDGNTAKMQSSTQGEKANR